MLLLIVVVVVVFLGGGHLLDSLHQGRARSVTYSYHDNTYSPAEFNILVQSLIEAITY
jgi:hypothetical protein